MITTRGLGINLPSGSLKVINIFGYPTELFSEDLACIFDVDSKEGLKLF